MGGGGKQCTVEGEARSGNKMSSFELVREDCGLEGGASMRSWHDPQRDLAAVYSRARPPGSTSALGRGIESLPCWYRPPLLRGCSAAAPAKPAEPGKAPSLPAVLPLLLLLVPGPAVRLDTAAAVWVAAGSATIRAASARA